MKATVRQDMESFSVCWEAECPDCGHLNGAYIPVRRMCEGSIHGVGAYQCDDCERWFPINFDLDYAKKIRGHLAGTTFVMGERG